jgi:hypothetical protein
MMAQEEKGFSVAGSVVDSVGKPVEYANVRILSPKDSSYVKGVVADVNGLFTISPVLQGEYILSVTHLLYNPYYMNIQVSTDRQLPSIRLSENTKSLSEVTITASSIQYQADRSIVSLKDNPIVRGNTAAQVLEYLPGISKYNNALQIYGRNVSRFYIDNRRVRDQKELDALMAEQIDKVEIIYTTGSEHKASEDGGIIRIKLKKLPEGGYYGRLPAVLPITRNMAL